MEKMEQTTQNERIYKKLAQITPAKDIYIARDIYNDNIEISSYNKNALHKIRKAIEEGHVVQSDCERYIYVVNVHVFKERLAIY